MPPYLMESQFQTLRPSLSKWRAELHEAVGPGPGNLEHKGLPVLHDLAKEAMFPSGEHFRMFDEILDTFAQQYINRLDTPEVTFARQGGEPTMLGAGSFRMVIWAQQLHASGKIIHNAIQTYGTLLDNEWGESLARNRFLVGLSLDGPRPLRNAYRVDKWQQPTFDLVIRGLKVLKKHPVEFNTLTVVIRRNSEQPSEVDAFLKEIGSDSSSSSRLSSAGPRSWMRRPA